MQIDRELSRINFWRIAINSTASFVLAFLLVFYLNHFTLILSTGMFHYPVSFDFGSITFHIEPNQWTHDAVKLMYGAGPILIFIAGLIAVIAFFSIMEETARLKIFFAWLALHAFNFFFGGLLIGNIFKQGVGHVFNWMYLTDTSKMLIAIIGFFGLLTTAILMSRPMAISANSYFNNLKDRNRPFFVMAQIIVPYVIGSVAAVLYFLPRLHFQEKYSWISLGILLMIMVGRIMGMDSIYFDEEERRPAVSNVVVLTALAAYFGGRIILNSTYFINW